MIRHLRWKVVATNMLLISLVLLAVFAAVFFISRGQLPEECAAAAVSGAGAGGLRHQPAGGGQHPLLSWRRSTAAAPSAWPGNSYYDLSDETRLADIVTAALAPDGGRRHVGRISSALSAPAGLHHYCHCVYRYLSGIHLPAHTAEGLLSGGLRRTGGAVSVQLSALRCGYQACGCRLGPAGAVPLRRQP